MTETGAAVVRTLLVLCGPAMGSAAALLAERLPVGAPVILTRSVCRSCGVVLRWSDLVPILSWLWRRGHCSHCGTPIPARLIQAELVGLAFGLAAAVLVPGLAAAVLGALILWCLLALALADLQHFRLPNMLTAGLLLLALGLALVGDDSIGPAWPDRLITAAIGAALGAGSFALLRVGYRWWRGRDGLGAGDVRLMAGIGALVGPFALPQVTLLAGVAALLLAVRRAHRRGRSLRARQMVPFGAFLAMAAAVVWLIMIATGVD